MLRRGGLAGLGGSAQHVALARGPRELLRRRRRGARARVHRRGRLPRGLRSCLRRPTEISNWHSWTFRAAHNFNAGLYQF